jgi:ATP-dependent RNA helicase RhlE
MQEKHPTFDSLGLIPELLSATKRAGYERPTPIQQLAIPPALAGRDVLGCAQTGTGKTATFTLPMLQHLNGIVSNKPRLRALIVTPTRELAAQIGKSIETYGQDLKLWHTVIFGGVNDKPQIAEVRRGVDLMVATPGRLLDLMGRGDVKLDEVELFVLDEADRMLDMGFLPDVRRITKALPKNRQTMFFSATMPPEIRRLAEGLLDRPVSVAVAPISSTVDLIDQKVFFVKKAQKRKALEKLLREPEVEHTLVFSRTKHGANRIVRHLEQAGIAAAAIHGNKSQAARTRALDAFRNGTLKVLVATDIAARGIDVDGVTHVINFDLPNVPETYVHRIGRTARAGASGVAWSLCDAEERSMLFSIEKLIDKRLGTANLD